MTGSRTWFGGEYKPLTEPATVLLFGFGLIGLADLRRKL